jgi:hypothetical protein
MKTRALCIAAIAAASFLSACASSTERAESKSVSSARSFRDDLTVMPSRVDATMNKLYEVTSTTNTNRGDSYNAFRDQLQYLQQDANRVSGEADKAKSDRERYFREWNREAAKSDPAKREEMKTTAAAERLRYDTAVSYLDSAKQNYRDLIAQLNDINKKLGANLGSYSSPEVQDGVSNAVLKSTNLKNYMARLTEQIDTALAGVPTN